MKKYPTYSCVLIPAIEQPDEQGNMTLVPEDAESYAYYSAPERALHCYIVGDFYLIVLKDE